MQFPGHLSENQAHPEKLFLAFVATLLSVGTLMVYSASMTSLAADSDQIFFKKHGLFLAISLCAGTITSLLPSSLWRAIAPFLYLGTLFLLVAVLLPGFGHRVNGAQRWLKFGPLSFQPSEVAKLTIPLVICWVRCHSDGSLKEATFRQVAGILAIVSLPVGFILIEPDLGTMLFVALIAGVSLFLSGVPFTYFLFAGLGLIPAVLGLIALKPYQLARIQGFIQAWTNPEAAPYQIRQSLTTLGVGGIEGTGLGRGWQKLSFLPEANTDFIFSVIGEELGLLGTLGVITLWLGLYLTGLRLIHSRSATSFESIVATTLLTQLLLQAAINVAVVTAMVPPKGISHPLISYGGSNLVTSLTAIGIIISLTRRPNTPVETAASVSGILQPLEFNDASLETELTEAEVE